jgi:hypothetical protein
MAALPEQIYFRSSLFQVEEGEEDEVNPGRYGRQLARWLQVRFAAVGYFDTEVIAEDWGWCVMLQRDPFMLWIGCGNMDTDDDVFDPLKEPERIVWHCFVTGELPFWQRLFRKVDPEAVKKVEGHLAQIIHEEPQVWLVSVAEV